MELRDGLEMVALSDADLARIALNLQEGRAASFMGESKLYVGNIAFECNEQDLHDLFAEAGQVGDVSLVRDDIGRNRGFGFITMRTKEGGEKAMELLDGKEVKGRNIAVRESNGD
jgi:RNA recognition motif-containing protein